LMERADREETKELVRMDSSSGHTNMFFTRSSNRKQRNSLGVVVVVVGTVKVYSLIIPVLHVLMGIYNNHWLCNV